MAGFRSPLPGLRNGPGITRTSLLGTSRNDHIVGTDGDDDISGLNASDLLEGRGGNDMLIGGNGNDTLDGGADNDTLDGGEGGDRLLGGDGNDSLSGGNGVDNLDGGTGSDILLGGNGADSLAGGAGDDTLNGGLGPDTFVFNKASENGVDTIVDFNHPTDSLFFKQSDYANALWVGGVLAASDFTTIATGAAPSATDGRHFTYDTSTGALWYDSDGNGPGGATQIATLNLTSALAADDFRSF